MNLKRTNNIIGDKGMAPIFAAVSLSFLLAIIVSIYSLAMLARENTKEIDSMLAYSTVSLTSQRSKKATIVVNLLKLMGSEIHVGSEYGKGSRFWFVISQKVVSETPIGDYSKRLEASRKKEATESVHAPSAKVLVVDDNEMNLKVAKNLLGLLGIRPEISDSGFGAIDLIREKHYHLILLDHMMPKMDGKETLTKMKAEKLLPDDTKVVVLTANAVNGAREGYLASGFDDYLSKPIEVKELDECLAAEDLKEFEVKIHALKSTSKTIGASALAGIALTLEEAAGDKDAESIREAYPDFVIKYEELVQTITQILHAVQKADKQGV